MLGRKEGVGWDVTRNLSVKSRARDAHIYFV